MQSTQDALEDAIRFTREMEARTAWDAAVFPDGVRRMGDELRTAEGRAFQANPDAWRAYRDARIAFLEGRKGRPLTAGELMWEGLDRPPGGSTPTGPELLNGYGRERFMVAGHPEPRRPTVEERRALVPPDDSTKGGGPLNPEIIEILRKYGIIAPPVAAGAAASFSGEPQQ